MRVCPFVLGCFSIFSIFGRNTSQHSVYIPWTTCDKAITLTFGSTSNQCIYLLLFNSYMFCLAPTNVALHCPRNWALKHWVAALHCPVPVSIMSHVRLVQQWERATCSISACSRSTRSTAWTSSYNAYMCHGCLGSGLLRVVDYAGTCVTKVQWWYYHGVRLVHFYITYIARSSVCNDAPLLSSWWWWWELRWLVCKYWDVDKSSERNLDSRLYRFCFFIIYRCFDSWLGWLDSWHWDQTQTCHIWCFWVAGSATWPITKLRVGPQIHSFWLWPLGRGQVLVVFWTWTWTCTESEAKRHAIGRQNATPFELAIGVLQAAWGQRIDPRRH